MNKAFLDSPLLKKSFILDAILNSYSVLFFSNSKFFAILLLCVSFFNPIAGLSGFIAVSSAIIISAYTGLNEWNIKKGLYSYNALLIGVGMGTFFNLGLAFWLLLILIVLVSVVLSTLFLNKLGKAGLPFLSIPFVLCFWIILLIAANLKSIHFTVRNIYWLNEMFALGNTNLVQFVLFFENLKMPLLLSIFFKALSSIFFQNNIFSGIIISIGVLIHSRIVFSMLIIGFLTAYGFNSIVHAYDSGINYYLLGVNFMMTSVAIGSFFVIPSFYSYIWAIVSVPITFILVLSLNKVMGIIILPVYSLPFCITVISLLYFFILKEKKQKLILTPLQFYSPEKNLYHFINNKERLIFKKQIRFQLPFLGQWMVSQGYDGTLTHKEDWGKALDFIIVDNELKTYKELALTSEDFYCYNKPILAPANGFVEEIIDYIDDNKIGKINQELNWGNSIVIKHADGVYCMISHLLKNSIKVNKGDYVKQGHIVAQCGNSGRSPEPHVHFQIQATSYIGSKTMAYPLASYYSFINGKAHLNEFKIPDETEIVQNITVNNSLKNVFEFLPGFKLKVLSNGFTSGNWEVFTDAYNQSYIYCHNEKSTAYFQKNESFFYFTSFYGNENSLLYFFYLSAYKILLSTDHEITITDSFPLQFSRNYFIKFVQDFIAPFYIFSRLLFKSSNHVNNSDFINNIIHIQSSQFLKLFTSTKKISSSTIKISHDKIAEFSIQINNKMITAICQ